MNILVTGAAGFVGHHLVERLCDSNKVYGVVHDATSRRGSWTPIWADVTNYARMLEIIVNCEIDQIYHLAAKSIVRNCVNDPVGCFHTNVIGTATVLESARQSGRVKGIMVMESDKSYGPGPVPYREDQTLIPQGIYEASKSCVSHIMTSYYRNYGLPVFSVRSANIYGPGDSNYSRLIPNTITRTLRGEKAQVTDGAQGYVREFVYVDDVCDCMERLMAVGPWGQTINVGSGISVILYDLIEILCEQLGVPMTVDEWAKPSNLLEISDQRLCLDKLHHLLPDYKPTPLGVGLQKTIEYYKGIVRCASAS
jgi:CDP-glucose 4,6-dehydratase